MEIQTLVHYDVDLIGDLLPSGWEGVIPTLKFYTKSGFCYPIKVIADEQIVGIGTAAIHNDVAWLAHIIVHPRYRNQSIGKLITQTLVDYAKAAGCDTIYLLATDLGEPVYKKTGFETETEYVCFKGEKITGTLSNTDNIVPFTSDFQNQIYDMDRQVSGEDRVFQLEPYLPGGFVYVQDNETKGFYLPALGHGLIIATSTAAGHELMKLRLTSKDFAAFPIDNIDAAAFIRQHHFKEVRREKRMRLGKKRNWQRANIYNRIGGNLG